MRRKPGTPRRKIDWKAVRQRLDEALVRFEADGAISDEERLLRAQRARILARAEVAEPQIVAGVEVLEFTVQSRRLAVPSSVVVEVLRDTTLTPVPSAARGLAGLTSRHGHVIPVFDLGTCLGMVPPVPVQDEVTAGQAPRIILLGVARGELGLLVDTVGGLTVCASESMLPVEAQDGGAPDALWMGRTPGGCRVIDGAAVLSDRRFFAAPSPSKGEA